MTKKMMNSITRQMLATLFVVDITTIALCIIFFDINVLYNTQVGFISATLIMFASMASYRRMVNARVANGMVAADDAKDVIDRLEDPYDLYAEEEETDDETRPLSEVLKEEKQKRKASRRSLTQTLRDTKAALSLYRIGAYVVLILGFMYLVRHGILHVPSLIIGIALPIVTVVTILLRHKTQD
jgi:hypothetical protein